MPTARAFSQPEVYSGSGLPCWLTSVRRGLPNSRQATLPAIVTALSDRSTVRPRSIAPAIIDLVMSLLIVDNSREVFPIFGVPSFQVDRGAESHEPGTALNLDRATTKPSGINDNRRRGAPKRGPEHRCARPKSGRAKWEKSSLWFKAGHIPRASAGYIRGHHADIPAPHITRWAAISAEACAVGTCANTAGRCSGGRRRWPGNVSGKSHEGNDESLDNQFVPFHCGSPESWWLEREAITLLF